MCYLNLELRPKLLHVLSNVPILLVRDCQQKISTARHTRGVLTLWCDACH